MNQHELTLPLGVILLSTCCVMFVKFCYKSTDPVKPKLKAEYQFNFDDDDWSTSNKRLLPVGRRVQRYNVHNWIEYSALWRRPTNESDRSPVNHLRINISGWNSSTLQLICIVFPSCYFSIPILKEYQIFNGMNHAYVNIDYF